MQGFHVYVGGEGERGGEGSTTMFSCAEVTSRESGLGTRLGLDIDFEKRVIWESNSGALGLGLGVFS